MKNALLALACLGLLAPTACAQEHPPVQSEQHKISYSLGYNIGRDFSQKQLDVDPDVLMRGMRDALSGSTTALSEDEMRQAMMDLQKKMLGQQQQQVKQLAETNEQAGKAFLAENRQKEGIKTTMSGLQYKVISKGTGKKPGPNDKVTVHYRGRLLDGTEFDSSYQRNKPATFPVGGVIPGWTEGLQLMKEGAKWQLFIPAKLAYGEKGAGPMIGPNSTLIFDVELVSIN
ncbi:MAG: peptidylprolyl isomerase [Desulfuromonadales bacterium C00003096]|jgi:FKBP-type peptidyl-prolyl cis-trans isomerase FklB|nr:MAG: peptidylprolyl isomerase [Desulfuromonadales bacterium C00003096]